MEKILLNATASPIFIRDMGIEVPASGQYTIYPNEYPLWATSVDVVGFITANSLIVNNGTADLSVSDGIRFLLWPDRLTVKHNDIDVTKVVTSINITGNATITDNSNGAVTIDVTNGSTATPLLREVTMVVFPGVGPVNIKLGLLFEADPENDTVLFLGEEIF